MANGALGAKVTLVKNGRPLAGIVIAAEKPTRSAQLAAFELRHVVKLITGAELPIITNSAAVQGVVILVGESEATRKLNIPDPVFQGEEYLVQFARGRIVLLGNDSPDYGKVDYADEKTYPALQYTYRSTTFAVYDFLEKCCGVRFYSFGDDGIALEKRATLAVHPLSIRTSPKMDAYRCLSLGGRFRVAPRDLRLLQMRWRLNNLFGSANHSIYSIFYRYWGKSVLPHMAKLFIEKRPEYFAQARPGSRNSLSEWSYPNEDIPAQLCPSHPGPVAYFADEAFKVFQGEKVEGGYGNHVLRMTGQPWYYPIQEEDNQAWCQCATCRNSFTNVLPELRYGYLHFDWVNRIAAAAAKHNPAIGISTLAYESTLPYPDSGVLKLQTNIAVQMCLGIQFWYHPGVYAWQHTAYKDWATNEGSRRPLGVWVYMLQPAWDAQLIYHYDQFFPVLYPWRAGRYFKEFVQDGVRGCFAEVRMPFNLLEAYVACKVCFDASADPAQVIDEYFALYYGKAGEPMRQFYKRIEEITWNPANYPAKLDGYGWTTMEGSFPRQSFTYNFNTEKVNWHLGTPERMAELQALVDQALSQAQAPQEKQRVHWLIENVWGQAVAGRKAFEERQRVRALPFPSLVVTDYAGECGGAPEKVDFNEAAKSGGWATVDGYELAQKPGLSFASDSSHFYIRYHESGDKAMRHQGAGLLTNRVEIFVAAQQGYPYGQMTVTPSGEFRALRHLGAAQTNVWAVTPVINSQLNAEGWTLTLSLPLKELLSNREATPGSMLYANFVRTRGFDGETSWSWVPLYVEGYAERLYRSLGRIFLAPLAQEGDLPVNGSFQSASGALPDGWKQNGDHPGTIASGNGRVTIRCPGSISHARIFPARRGDEIVFEFTAKGKGDGSVGALFACGGCGTGSAGQRFDTFKVTADPQTRTVVLPVVNLPYPRLFTAGFQPVLSAGRDSQVEYSGLHIHVNPRGK